MTTVAEPTQEMWVSRSLNIYMITKTSEGLVLCDIDKKHKWIKQSDHASPELTMLSERDCTRIEATITGYLDLLPFANISDVPKDAIWDPEANNSSGVTNENQKVYKLTWTDKTYGGILVPRKSLYFVNPETGLPNRVKHYVKSPMADEYILQTEMVVKRLSDDEIRTAVQEVFP